MTLRSLSPLQDSKTKIHLAKVAVADPTHQYYLYPRMFDSQNILGVGSIPVFFLLLVLIPADLLLRFVFNISMVDWDRSQNLKTAIPT
jgi:hypothetical protein